MGSTESPIISVVEELKGQQLDLDQEDIYSPSYWLPHLPVNFTEFIHTGESSYQFHIVDTIKLDPTGTLKADYDAIGKITFLLKENTPKKGYMWEFDILVEEPEAHIQGTIRARNLSKNLKIGIYIYQLDSNDPRFLQFGKDPIYFAIRLYLRKLISQFKLA